MTMTRNAKATHQDLILGADTDDLIDWTFTSPTEIAKRGGRRQMTRAEYIVHHMNRTQQNIEMAIDRFDRRRRYRRTVRR